MILAMKGRFWLLLGLVVGVAVSVGQLPYLAGAGHTLTDTAEKLVQSGVNHLVQDAASRGAPRRVVLGLGSVVVLLIPGIAALLLVLAARTTLRLRALIALAVVALGVASYAYHPHGEATGVLVLALVVAGLAVTLTGPLVAAPLTFGAGLIGAEYLPTLVHRHEKVTQASVEAVHQAIFNSAGNPLVLQVLLLVLAALPFAWGLRLLLR